MKDGPAKPSIEDVARLAGVSTATVSRTFSQPDIVSEKTRRRVQEAASELGFYISRTAAILKSGHLHRIALLFGGSQIDWFTARIIDGLDLVLRDAGYDLVVYPIGYGDVYAKFFEELPVRGNADAVIVSSLTIAPQQRRLLDELGIPVVGINSNSPGISASVSIDDHHAIETALRYLIELGHRHIAYVYDHFPASPHFSSMERIQAFMKLCNSQHGIDGDLIRIDDTSNTRGEVVASLLGAADRPTALLFHQDSLAIPFFFTMQCNGFSIPQDVSVMGFDDSTFAADVGLTTIRQDPVRMAASAAQKTLDLVHGRPLTEAHETASTQLIIRTSTIRHARGENGSNPHA